MDVDADLVESVLLAVFSERRQRSAATVAGDVPANDREDWIVSGEDKRLLLSRVLMDAWAAAEKEQDRPAERRAQLALEVLGLPLVAI